MVLLDNDSRVTEGWLQPLLDAGGGHHAVVTPLILEREGVDRARPAQPPLHRRTRVVDVEGTPYPIEHKHFRRTEVSTS